MLEGEPVRGGGVRGLILTSWAAVPAPGLPADHLELPYQPDRVDYGGRLRHAALPVLDRLESMLAGNRMSVILTDADARVTERRAGDPSLNSHLDAISLAPGFGYAEDFAGTNGIGSALTEKRAYGVFGREHFSETLQPFSCAGTPIHDPFTGRIVGIIDLTVCGPKPTRPCPSCPGRRRPTLSGGCWRSAVSTSAPCCASTAAPRRGRSRRGWS